MCLRWVKVSPRSRSGFSSSLTLDDPTLFSPPMRVTSPMARENVYDAWNCEPRPKRLTSWVCNE